MRFRHITEITILTVQLIVEFAKRLPGFDKLLREDQIALLKACSSEVMMLRMARKYDVVTDSIIFANNQPYTRDSYSLAGMGETIEDLLHFCRQMYAMKVNNAEYALLTAIVIFSGELFYLSTVFTLVGTVTYIANQFVSLLLTSERIVINGILNRLPNDRIQSCSMMLLNLMNSLCLMNKY